MAIGAAMGAGAAIEVRETEGRYLRTLSGPAADKDHLG